MPIGWVAAAGAVAGLAGSMMQSDAATSAADTQAQAARDAAQIQADAAKQNIQYMREMYGQVSPYWQPYVGVGTQGVSQIQSMLPYLTQQYPTYKPATTAEVMAQLPANYEFMKQQGLGSLAQQMNVGGGGSNIGRAATKFAEDYASTGYQNALQNYMSQQQQQYNQQQGQRTGIYNTLASIAGIGQQGVAGLSNLATGTATNIANLQTAGAQAQAAGLVGAAGAQAAGQVGSASALAGGLNSASNFASLYGLSRMNQSGGQVTNTPYTTQSPTGPGTYNVGGSEMVINAAP